FLKRGFEFLKVLSFILFAGVVVSLAACSTTDTSDTTNQTTDEITTVENGTIITTEAPTTNVPTTVAPTTIAPTTVAPTTEEPVNMDATLTDLSVNGTTVLGFNATKLSYVLVLSSEEDLTPVITTIKYETSSSVVIVDPIDVSSNLESERTATITVTTDDELTTLVYMIIFETVIDPVDLGTADDFVILAQTGISSETSSAVTGDIGVSPSAATYITGFSLILDSAGTFSTSSQVVGQVYASDYTSPTPSVLTTAISDMQTAYIDAAGRVANYNNLFSGDLSGQTLTTGVYNFGSGVLINGNLTLTGSSTDVWIFQISGTLTQAAGIDIILSGGALAENIIWQVADTVSIGTGAHFEGTILAMTNISFGTNSSINGSLYAQTAVTLDASTVTKP
ncbi:MAG: ice-binding family protein, partial [Tenericutes bacterium]|nr:ice-binding family protein [Mycoplasmatota bacterium]